MAVNRGDAAQPGVERLQLGLVLAIPFLVMYAWLNFAPVLPAIRDEFALNNTWSGMLTSATVLTHMALQLPSGYITDTLGGKWAIAVGGVIMGVAIVGTALAPNFAVLLAFRFMLGIGTATSFIAGLAFAREFVPRDRWIVVQGIYGGAGSLGILVALLTSERLAYLVTWRGMFLITGLVVLAYGVLAVVVLKSRANGVVTVKPSWRRTFSQPHLYILGLSLGLTYGVFNGLVTWVAMLLLQQHGIGPEWAGPLGAIITFTAVVGRFASGPVAKGREWWTITSTVLATAVLTIALPLMPSLPLAIVAMLLVGWTANVAFGAVFSYPSLLSQTGASGRDLSLINFVANIGAFVFPLMIGWGLDIAGTFEFGFALVGGIGILGAIVIYLRLPKARRQPVEA